MYIWLAFAISLPQHLWCMWPTCRLHVVCMLVALLCRARFLLFLVITVPCVPHMIPAVRGYSTTHSRRALAGNLQRCASSPPPLFWRTDDVWVDGWDAFDFSVLLLCCVPVLNFWMVNPCYVLRCSLATLCFTFALPRTHLPPFCRLLYYRMPVLPR